MNLGIRRPIVLAPIDFPRSTLLDNFNRADENALSVASSGVSWTGPWFTRGGINSSLGVLSNKCQVYGSIPGSAALAPDYGPDLDTWITLTSVFNNDPSEFTFLLRGNTLGTPASTNGYIVHFAASIGSLNGSPSPYQPAIGLIQSGALSFPSAAQNMQIPAVSAGDSIGASIVGTKITAWHKPASTGVWGAYSTYDDGPGAGSFPNAGKIGFCIDDNIIVDDFGGGTRR